MSSFDTPHHLYLFGMKNGKKKLGYGKDPEHALEILGYRLGKEEMDEIIVEDCQKISQRNLQQYVHELG